MILSNKINSNYSVSEIPRPGSHFSVMAVGVFLAESQPRAGSSTHVVEVGDSGCWWLSGFSSPLLGLCLSARVRWCLWCGHVTMLPWCDVTVSCDPTWECWGKRRHSPFVLDFWLMNLGSKDTEKHVQDPEAYFKNFLPLKIPQWGSSPPLGLSHLLVSGGKGSVPSLLPSKQLPHTSIWGLWGLLRLGLSLDIWRGRASL